MNQIRLGVNIDHVATVREARKGKEPDPVAAAIICEIAGADGIVCHLREDRRHIRDRDLRILKEVVKTHLNLEMAATDEMVRIAVQVQPDMCTLVPEKREEITTEGGLDVLMNLDRLKDVVATLRSNNIVISLFIDPDVNQVKAAAKLGTDYVEFHTGKYCNAADLNTQNDELHNLQAQVLAAVKLGLGVSAGHGLNYHNVSAIARISQIEELNIGHSIVSRAVLVGLERAVKEMLDLMHAARR